MRQNTANKEIREALKENGIKHWELADLLGINHYTLMVRLRHELPEEEKARTLKLIEKEAKRRGKNHE